MDSDFTGTQVLQIATLKHTKKHTPNVPESRRGRTALCDAAGTDCPVGLHVAARGPVCGAVLCPISDTVCDSITVLSCLRSEWDPLCHNDSCHITICTVHTAQKCRGGEWRRSFLLGIPTTRMQFPFVKLPALRVLSLDGKAFRSSATSVIGRYQYPKLQRRGGLGRNSGGPKWLSRMAEG